MSMNTYAFHEQACLLIDTDVAAAVNLRAMAEDGPAGGIPPGITDVIAAEGPYAAVTKHRDLFPPEDLEDLMDVQAAMEHLEPHGIDCGFASGFEGSARTIEELRDKTADREWKFDDDFMAIVPHLNEMSLFDAAYPDVDALVREFRDRLGPVLGDGFPYASYVVDIVGTYYC